MRTECIFLGHTKALLGRGARQPVIQASQRVWATVEQWMGFRSTSASSMNETQSWDLFELRSSHLYDGGIIARSQGWIQDGWKWE